MMIIPQILRTTMYFRITMRVPHSKNKLRNSVEYNFLKRYFLRLFLNCELFLKFLTVEVIVVFSPSMLFCCIILNQFSQLYLWRMLFWNVLFSLTPTKEYTNALEQSAGLNYLCVFKHNNCYKLLKESLIERLV